MIAAVINAGIQAFIATNPSTRSKPTQGTGEPAGSHYLTAGNPSNQAADTTLFHWPASTAITLAFRIKLQLYSPVAGTQYAIMGIASGGDGNVNRWNLVYLDGNFRLGSVQAFATTVTCSVACANNAIHSVVITRSTAGVWNMYIDSVSNTATMTQNIAYTNSIPFKVGVLTSVNSSTMMIGEIRSWASVLSSSDITSYMAGSDPAGADHIFTFDTNYRTNTVLASPDSGSAASSTISLLYSGSITGGGSTPNSNWIQQDDPLFYDVAVAAGGSFTYDFPALASNITLKGVASLSSNVSGSLTITILDGGTTETTTTVAPATARLTGGNSGNLATPLNIYAGRVIRISGTLAAGRTHERVYLNYSL